MFNGGVFLDVSILYLLFLLACATTAHFLALFLHEFVRRLCGDSEFLGRCSGVLNAITEDLPAKQGGLGSCESKHRMEHAYLCHQLIVSLTH